jgi:hypothetical protein
MGPGISSAAEAPTPQDFGEIFKLIGGYRISQAIYMAVALGIPDLLAAGPKRCDELAKATGTSAPTLHRLLRFLAGAGLLEEAGPESFGLTRVGAALRTDVSGSAAMAVRLWLSDFHWTPWAHLIHSVRTGEPAFDRAHGMGVFEYLREHGEASAIFNAAMTSNTARSGTALAERYDFADVAKLVDAGGGQGLLLATILKAHPAMRGVLYDLPDVVSGADRILADAGVEGRCEVIGGSFFDKVPAGGDAYILRQIIHDWNDERSLAILRNCRAAMTETGRLLLVEREIAPDHRKAMRVLHIDLEMMVNVAGLERTNDQYRALLADSGFDLARIVPLMDGAGFSIFEAAPLP